MSYERENNTSPDDLKPQAAGFKITGQMSGGECGAYELGYLFWLFLGGQALADADDTHVITPADVQEYFQMSVDRKTDLGSSTPTENSLGNKMTAFDLAIEKNAFVKVGFSTKACSLGNTSAALSSTLVAYPLSWHGLRAGTFKIGYGGAALAVDDTIDGIKITGSREVSDEDNIHLAADQPDSLTSHSRVVEFEIMRQFSGSSILVEYASWKNQVSIGIEVDFQMNSGAETVLIAIPNARIVGSYAGEVGSGDDSIMATLKCKAFVVSGEELITVSVDDGTDALYT